MSYSVASIAAVGIVLPLLALVAVILRFHLRFNVQPSYIGVDDWLIVGAVILAMADGANLAVGAIIGIQGRDYAPDQIPPERSIVEAKSDYAQVILEKPLYGMMKLSVLFFYRRIFLVQQRFRLFNNIMIILITAWTISFFVADILVCGAHPKVQWTNTPKSKACDGETWVNLFFSITDVIGDILVVSMPFPCIQTLQMRARDKAGLASIFFLGTLSTACSIVRLGFISQAFKMTVTDRGNQHAQGTPPAVWSSVEAAVGVLAACLPPLGPLIRRTPSPRHASRSLVNRMLSRAVPYHRSATTLDTDGNRSKTHLKPYQPTSAQDMRAHSSFDDTGVELDEHLA